jgi:hypothetical protein
MPRTRNDLILQVLENLNAVGAGQTPAPEDVATISNRIDTRLATLAFHGVVYVPDTDAIDDEVFDDLATLVAQSAAPAYGQAPDPEKAARAERSLRGLQTITAYPPLRVQYF